jgi:DNA-binding transcriptional LysR family regulator
MPDPSFDLRLFRYAITAADHGSFRRAAAKLNVQQSSVSRGVRSLEHRLGAPLFERSHAGVHPTPAGQQFLKEAALGFDHLDRAMRAIGAVGRGKNGEITVAVSVPFPIVGDLFERFRIERQGASVEITEGTCHDSATLVQQRKADIAFLTNAPVDRSVRSLTFSWEPVSVVLPKSHRLAGVRRPLEPDELRSENFIFRAGGLGPELAAYLKHDLFPGGGEPKMQSFRIGQCDLINMVARGFGVTAVLGTLPAAAVEDVVLVPLSGRNTIPVHAIWLAGNANPVLKVFLRIARRLSAARRRDGL